LLNYLKSLVKLLYKDIIEFGDRKFLLYRTVREFEKLNAELLKQFWHCDTVLKKENIFYFCNEIKEIDYEEIRHAADATAPN
jgi:hypothetical protein